MTALWVVSMVLLWVVVGALVIVMLGMLRQLGLLEMRVGPDPGVLVTREGLDRGSPAPAFRAVDVRSLEAAPIDSGSLRGTKAVMTFLTPTCVACRQLVPHLNALAKSLAKTNTRVITVCYGSEATCREFAGAFGLQVPLLHDPANQIGKAYAVEMTPFSYLLSEDGMVLLRGVTNTWPQLEALVDQEGTIQQSSWVPVDGDYTDAGKGSPADQSPLAPVVPQ